MALWRCLSCDTRYSVGAPCCPQCSGTDYTEDGEMPKIHANRPDTYEPVELEAAPPADGVPAEAAEPAEEPKSRKRNVVRAQAGHAAGAGGAGSVG